MRFWDTWVMTRSLLSSALLLLCGVLASCVPVQVRDVPAGATDATARLELLARMQTLNAELLASRSATQVLERWCRIHALAAAPVIVAQRIKAEPVSPPADLMQRLRVADQRELSYRRVELRCGDVILSKADNWYVPARLSDDMNRALAETDTPFGKVVAPLEPFRQTIAASLLWSPMASNITCASHASPLALAHALPAEIFQHRAVLYTREMQPFSEVSEVYQGAALAFPLQYCDVAVTHDRN